MIEHHLETSNATRLTDRSDNPHPAYHLQEKFFEQAFSEEPGGRTPLQAGPYYEIIAAHLAQTKQELAAIGPEMTAEFLTPLAYQSAETQKMYKRLSEATLQQLAKVKYYHDQRLGELSENQIVPALINQELPVGSLNTPPFHHQREDWSSKESRSACVNACFRMIFDAITGWNPSERVVATQLIERYGTSIVDDDVYNAVFKTEAFRHICQKKVSCRLVIGADFNYITERIKHLKHKLPGAEVYCAVNLASEAVMDTWHACILLGTNEDGVVCHDPSPMKGGEHRVIQPAAFFKRWAEAYNKAQLVIAV